MNKYPYIIMAPPYRHNSSGVRALYELHNQLEYRGYQVSIMTMGYAPPDAIVIYPETVPGNPLYGRKVVRWVLYYPEKLSGDKVYDTNEIIFTWSKLFYDAPVLTVPTIEDFFKNEDLPRSGGCFWVGKGDKVPCIPETEGLTEITLAWPETRKELAKLFNEKEVFYTYDDTTALTTEAALCGCKVIVIPGEKENDYNESIKNYDKQIENFINITQSMRSKAQSKIKVVFGILVNNLMRLDMVFRQSELDPLIKCHTIKMPETATKGFNKLLEIMENEGNDIAILSHQDMYYRSGWIEQVIEKIGQLPDSWVVAGIIGKDMEGKICGRMHDMRIPLHFSTSHNFPHPASCFDECCIIINLKKGFRFDEGLPGFDLYGTLVVLQTWEMGGTAWIIDCFCEHYCMRSFDWYPDKNFEDCFKWIHQRFPDAKRIDSTVMGVQQEIKEEVSV